MNLNVILDIMSTWNLSADELLLIYLTFICQSENGNTNKGMIFFEKWYNSGGSKKLKNLFESLKDKNIIIKNYDPSCYNPEEIQFNKLFLKKYFKLTGELGQELVNHYPSYMTINNKIVSLKNIAKYFTDFNDLYFKYAITIGHNIDKHKEIIDILEWAKSQNLVTVSISEFIISHKWNEYKQLRDKGITGIANVSDIYELA